MLLEKPLPLTYAFSRVRWDLGWVVFVSLAVHLVTERYEHFLPVMPPTIPGFIGTAISVLLSFRMAQSYDRWWEARKVWGSIVNDSRSLVVQLKSFVKEGSSSVIERMALRQIAWCYCLGQSLRGLDPKSNIGRYLAAEEMDEISKPNNKPLALLSHQARDLRRLREDDQLELFYHVQMDDTLVRLCAAQGQAERIKSTIFPVTYRYSLHAIIYLFVVVLSVSLKDVPFRFELPLLLAISCPFFLLEESATQLQDPFQNRPTDTAVTTISTTIEINLKELVGLPDVPPPRQPEAFYQN